MAKLDDIIRTLARHTQILEAVDVRTGNSDSGRLAQAADRILGVLPPRDLSGAILDAPVELAGRNAGRRTSLRTRLAWDNDETSRTQERLASLEAKIDRLAGVLERALPKSPAGAGDESGR